MNIRGNEGNTLQFVGTFNPVNEAKEVPKVKDTIKMIAGKLNNCNQTYYWEIDDEHYFQIGDYAIVENMNDYDLVKIVGVVETTEKYARFIVNAKVNKKVVDIVPRMDIRED